MQLSKTPAQVGVERTTKRKSRKKLDRLTRDAIAAQEAGMSYGQYKALHPYTPEEDDEEETTTERDARKNPSPLPLTVRPGQKVRTCDQCGQLFAVSAQQTNKRYCSDECREKHHIEAKAAKKKRNKPGKTVACAICGADFVTGAHNRIYCSTECYAEGQHRRNRERWEEHKKNLKKEEAKKNGSN